MLILKENINMKTETNREQPDWTAENRNREKGDTTFSICGWCKFAGSGSYRYNCMLEGSCNLLKDYDDRVRHDTPCKIAKLGKLDLNDIIGHKKYKIEEAKRSIETKKGEIGILQSLAEKAENIPPLPNARPDFKLKEIIWVFIEKCETVPQTNWYRGTVVSGYRSGDGCVSFILDDLPESKVGWGCGVSTPCTLKDWEYQYFRKNKKRFEIWLGECDRNYNGKRMDIAQMFKKLK